MRDPSGDTERPNGNGGPPVRLNGTLNRVTRVVKVLGMVNSAPDFYDHPKVINGCSELFAEIWGIENGVGARSAVGMGPLPGNIPVEIEGIFEIKS